MKATYRNILPLALVAAISIGAFSQVENAGGVRRRSERDKKKEQTGPAVTGRMQDFFTNEETHDADLEYMRQIYRQLDLQKPENQPLYFPEDVIDGQQNLFRIIMQGVVNGTVPAYEYLDGREVFTDKYKVKVDEMLDRFGIYYTKTGSEKNPVYTIEEADVPTAQVLTYYILEKWEYDRRTNRMKTRVEAICPVLNRSSDFGGEARYPMFWVKFDQLRPMLAQQYIFLTDDNNLPKYSLDDYFNLGMYDGEIYKTRNLRNLSMNQMFPDEDDRQRAQDSIDNRLRSYGKDRWVPTREEYLAQKEAEAKLAKGDTSAVADIPERTTVSDDDLPEVKEDRKKPSEPKKPKKKRGSTKSKVKKGGNNSNSNASKSVRRRRK